MSQNILQIGRRCVVPAVRHTFTCSASRIIRAGISPCVVGGHRHITTTSASRDLWNQNGGGQGVAGGGAQGGRPGGWYQNGGQPQQQQQPPQHQQQPPQQPPQQQQQWQQPHQSQQFMNGQRGGQFGHGGAAYKNVPREEVQGTFQVWNETSLLTLQPNSPVLMTLNARDGRAYHKVRSAGVVQAQFTPRTMVGDGNKPHTDFMSRHTFQIQLKEIGEYIGSEGEHQFYRTYEGQPGAGCRVVILTITDLDEEIDNEGEAGDNVGGDEESSSSDGGQLWSYRSYDNVPSDVAVLPIPGQKMGWSVLDPSWFQVNQPTEHITTFLSNGEAIVARELLRSILPQLACFQLPSQLPVKW